MKLTITNPMFAAILGVATAFGTHARAESIPASAAAVIPTEGSICTRDYNPWGLASRCECPEPSAYEHRIGQCITGQLQPLRVEGFISTQMAAIGGETTGIVLESSEIGYYELVLPLHLRAELEQAELSGRSFTVTGDYINIRGIESGDRPTLIVNTLTLRSDSVEPE